MSGLTDQDRQAIAFAVVMDLDRKALRRLSGACRTCGRGAPRSLAAAIGIGYSTLNRFMTGSRPVGPAALARIHDYIDQETRAAATD